MGGNDRLRYFHGHWPTNEGAWFPGETVRFRDKALFEDFADASWMTLMLYGINGRMPDANQSRMIEKIWSISSSFPDPRLDRKSTRLNSSHVKISYAVFCLKKKRK